MSKPHHLKQVFLAVVLAQLLVIAVGTPIVAALDPVFARVHAEHNAWLPLFTTTVNVSCNLLILAVAWAVVRWSASPRAPRLLRENMGLLRIVMAALAGTIAFLFYYEATSEIGTYALKTFPAMSFAVYTVVFRVAFPAVVTWLILRASARDAAARGNSDQRAEVDAQVDG